MFFIHGNSDEKIAKGAGPFQRTEVRQRDKGPLRNNPYFFYPFFLRPLMPFMNLKSTGYFCTTATRWQHAKQNGHVKDVRPAFSSSSRLARKRNCSFPDGDYL
jgi:hypothetical protein